MLETIEDLQHSEAYRQQLHGILSAELSPDNIDVAADHALEQTVSLVQAAVADFQSQTGKSYPSMNELEDAALHYFGLQDIGTILSHLDTISRQLKGIDALIAAAPRQEGVLVPPINKPRQAPMHTGTQNELPTSSRVKLIIFIMEHEFGVRVDDPDELAITTGVLTYPSMRTSSYYLINAPKLKRIVLACDQFGNATYIFNTAVLAKDGLTAHDISAMTKEALDAILDSNPRAGKKIFNHADYVAERFRLALQDPDSTPKRNPENIVHHSYLYPPAPRGVTSIKELARTLSVSDQLVAQALDELVTAGKLNAPGMYMIETRHEDARKSGKALGRGLTPTHQEAITSLLREAGNLNPDAPPDMMTISSVSSATGMAMSFLVATYKKLLEEGSIPAGAIYKFNNLPTLGIHRASWISIMKHIVETGRRSQTRQRAADYLAGLIKAAEAPKAQN